MITPLLIFYLSHPFLEKITTGDDPPGPLTVSEIQATRSNLITVVVEDPRIDKSTDDRVVCMQNNIQYSLPVEAVDCYAEDKENNVCNEKFGPFVCHTASSDPIRDIQIIYWEANKNKFHVLWMNNTGGIYIYEKFFHKRNFLRGFKH